MVCKTFKEFEKRWADNCFKIEKSELNEVQAKGISNNFLNEIIPFYSRCDDKDKKGRGSLLMIEIFNNLNLSLQIAISNHKKRCGESIKEKIFGVKNFQMDINAIKNVVNQ